MFYLAVSLHIRVNSKNLQNSDENRMSVNLLQCVFSKKYSKMLGLKYTHKYPLTPGVKVKSVIR
jgi:hypothetical protein